MIRAACFPDVALELQVLQYEYDVRLSVHVRALYHTEISGQAEEKHEPQSRLADSAIHAKDSLNVMRSCRVTVFLRCVSTQAAEN
jgi:hypothetical protein